jgi:hypothetical protein
MTAIFPADNLMILAPNISVLFEPNETFTNISAPEADTAWVDLIPGKPCCPYGTVFSVLTSQNSGKGIHTA